MEWQPLTNLERQKKEIRCLMCLTSTFKRSKTSRKHVPKTIVFTMFPSHMFSNVSSFAIRKALSTGSIFFSEKKNMLLQEQEHMEETLIPLFPRGLKTRFLNLPDRNISLTSIPLPKVTLSLCMSAVFPRSIFVSKKHHMLLLPYAAKTFRVSARHRNILLVLPDLEDLSYEQPYTESNHLSKYLSLP